MLLWITDEAHILPRHSESGYCRCSMLQLIDNCAQTVCSESIPNVSIVFEQMYLPLHPPSSANPPLHHAPFFFVCLSPAISSSLCCLPLQKAARWGNSGRALALCLISPCQFIMHACVYVRVHNVIGLDTVAGWVPSRSTGVDARPD